MDKIKEYKHIRKRLVEIHHRIIDSLTGKNILQTARVIGIVENKTIVFESELEQDALMDFAVYRQMDSGKSKIAEYVATNANIDEDEENLLKAMIETKTMLYEVIEVNRIDKTIKLKEVLNNSGIFTVVDLGMSETIDENVLIFTRLIHLETFSITSGLIFTFKHEHLEYLKKRSRKMMKKIEAENDSDKRFIAFFKLYRRDGIPFMLEEVK